ncbi:MAG: enoyl-CoA hydratase/isomerase family protein [Mycobacterium sp.]
MIELILDQSVATVLLRRPPVNAFDMRMLDLLDAAIEHSETAGARVLVVRSNNPKMFCAGADIAMLQAATERIGGVDEMVAFARRFQQVLDRLEQAPLATIAAIDGLALGGGLELALACDFRLAGPEAKMGLTETTLGLVPGAGGTQRLAAVIGRAKARQLVLTGRMVDGGEADRMGLADHCPDGAQAAAGELARTLAQRPARALALAKECVLVAPSAQGYERELTASRELYGDPETIDLLTTFLNRRKRPQQQEEASTA